MFSFSFENVFLAGIVQLICWSDSIVLSFSFRSLDWIVFQNWASYVFFLCCQCFCFGYMTSRSIQIFFVHAFMQFDGIACVASFFSLCGASFFIRLVKFWSHVTYHTVNFQLSKSFPWNLLSSIKLTLLWFNSRR